MVHKQKTPDVKEKLEKRIRILENELRKTKTYLKKLNTNKDKPKIRVMTREDACKALNITRKQLNDRARNGSSVQKVDKDRVVVIH